ncbi:hypothetical protein HanRHA438_Chr08g0328951 [Helianthus annuus]|nr:hypothetical protein HanRHA438_Chr08g0328951 [Helianthus annuus]
MFVCVFLCLCLAFSFVVVSFFFFERQIWITDGPLEYHRATSRTTRSYPPLWLFLDSNFVVLFLDLVNDSF